MKRMKGLQLPGLKVFNKKVAWELAKWAVINWLDGGERCKSIRLKRVADRYEEGNGEPLSIMSPDYTVNLEDWTNYYIVNEMEWYTEEEYYNIAKSIFKEMGE